MLSSAILLALSRRLAPVVSGGIRSCSTSSSSAPLSPSSSEPYYFTREDDPRKQEKKHMGRLYRLPDELLSRTPPELDPLLPPAFSRPGRLFGEQRFLIRRPAIEMFHYLRQLEERQEQTTAKFVLHGKKGEGEGDMPV
jgi:hypothetical protein